MVNLNTKDKYEFKCKKGHIFKMQLDNINKGCWCKFCYNKTEALFKETIENDYNLELQKTFDWCRNDNNNLLPFDFKLLDYNILIEIDGEQHFKQISNWKDYKTVQKTDLYKMDKANEKNYQIIRIYQPDVWYKNYDWYKMILFVINIAIKYTNIKRIFISSTNDYDNYAKLNNCINMKLYNNCKYKITNKLNNYINDNCNNNCEYILNVRHMLCNKY